MHMADRIFLAGSDGIASMLCDALKKARSYQPYILVVGSFASFLMLIVALFTDHWLNLRAVWAIRPHSGELLGSETMDNTTEVVQREKKSFSGLWRLCCGDVDCSGICRTLVASQNSDAAAATSSLYLIGVLRKTNIFPVVSVMLAFSGAVFVAAGMIWIAKKHVLSLAGGVNLVVSGLTNVLGIIIFISSNDKLSKRNSSGTEYGWSFYCAGLAFILTEILGVVIIQELVKDVESSNEDKSENSSNVQEEVVSQPNSLNSHRKSVSMPPSMNLRRSMIDSVRRKSRASLSNSGNDLASRGNLFSRENSAEIACATEPVMGLPGSDSGYNGASSFNLKLADPAKLESRSNPYASSVDSDHHDNDNDNLAIDLEQLKQTNLSRANKSTQRLTDVDIEAASSVVPKIDPYLPCTSNHSPILDYQNSVFSTNHTESTLSFPPPVEFQNEKRNSDQGTVDFLQATRFNTAAMSKQQRKTKPIANGIHDKRFAKSEPWNVMSKERVLQKVPSSNYHFLRKFYQHEQSSFDSNQSSPAALENGIDNLRGKAVPVKTLPGRRTPASAKSPLSVSGAGFQRGSKPQEDPHTSIYDSPIVKAFRSKLFSKQNWIKSRDLERGQSRDSDDIELRDIDQITDSGYRSAGQSNDGIAAHSLPRITRSRSTLPDGRIQVTRHDKETNRHFRLPGVATTQNLPSSPVHDHMRMPTFMSSNSSLIRAIRRSSSTSYLQEAGIGRTSANDMLVVLEKQNQHRTIGPNVWPGVGPITAL